MQTIQGLVLTTVMLAVLGSSAVAADSSADTLS